MHPPVETAAAPLYARRWWALATLCLSLLIVMTGNTSLNVVIPTLSRQLDATNSQLQWAVAVYSLVFAGLLFSTASLGDRFGRKGALQVGLGLFFIGSALASQANSMTQIIACRALMGIGAALIMPSTLSILVNIFPPHERQKAIALWASISGAGASLGPVMSGWMLGHFWYGSVFLVNLPLIAVAFVSGWYLVPKSKDPNQGKLDPLGAVLSSVGIASLVYGLIQAPEHGWSSPSTMVWFVVAVGGLTLFALWESRCDEPMLDVRYFKIPAFATGTGGMILLFLSMFGVMFLLTQYFQLIVGYSPLEAAVRFLPMSPVMMIVGMQSPRITAAIGANKAVAVGLLLSGASMIMLTGVRITPNYPYVLTAFILLAAGLAMSMSPMTAAIMSAVPPRRAGAGSATNDATREIGAALGVAVLGSVAASQFSNKIGPLVAGLPSSVQSESRSSLSGALRSANELGGPTGKALADGARHAFIAGIHEAALVGGLLLVVAAGCIWKFFPVSVSHAGAEQGHHGGAPGAGDEAALASVVNEN